VYTARHFAAVGAVLRIRLGAVQHCPLWRGTRAALHCTLRECSVIVTVARVSPDTRGNSMSLVVQTAVLQALTEGLGPERRIALMLSGANGTSSPATLEELPLFRELLGMRREYDDEQPDGPPVTVAVFATGLDRFARSGHIMEALLLWGADERAKMRFSFVTLFPLAEVLLEAASPEAAVAMAYKSAPSVSHQRCGGGGGGGGHPRSAQPPAQAAP
jgi:hypothetical protein